MKRFIAQSRTTAVACALALAAMLASGQKVGAAYQATFTEFNVGNTPGNFGTITLDDNSDDNTIGTNQIKVSFSITGGQIDQIGMNVPGNNLSSSIFPVSVSGQPTNWVLTPHPPTGFDGFGQFDLAVGGQNQDKVPSGSFTLTFSANVTTATLVNFNSSSGGSLAPALFAAEYFPTTGGTGFIGSYGPNSPAPAPAGLLLALVGMPVLGLGAWLRRRRAVTAAA